MMSWNKVGFGTGELNLKPFFKELKTVGKYSTTTILSNLVLAVAFNYFFLKCSVSLPKAAFVGLISAVSHTLTNKWIEHFKGNENLIVYTEKSLLVTSVTASIFVLCGKADCLPTLALGLMDIGMLEVGFCFNQ